MRPNDHTPGPFISPENRLGFVLASIVALLLVIAVINPHFGTSTGSETAGAPSVRPHTSALPTNKPGVVVVPSPVPPSPPPARLQWSGVRTQSTATFTLRGNSYHVTYTAGGACDYGISLRGVDGSAYPAISAQGPSRGDTYLHGVPAGQFYWNVVTGITGCIWSLTAEGA